MRTVLALTRKELEQYFASPIAYVVVALFLVLSGFFFYIYLGFYVQNAQYAAQMGGGEGNEISQAIIRPFLSNISFFFLIMFPMLTMKTMAEEKKLGTFELLMTSPVTTPQLLLGKFLGALSLVGVILLLLAIYPLVLVIYGSPDPGPIWTGFLGLFLLGAAFLASGIFFSSLTENQIVAAVFGFVFWLLLWIINFLSRSEAWYGKLFQYISVYERFEDFTKGILNLNDAFYFVSLAFLSLFATGIVIQSQRWKS